MINDKALSCRHLLSMQSILLKLKSRLSSRIETLIDFDATYAVHADTSVD